MALPHEVALHHLAGADAVEVVCETCEDTDHPYRYEASNETFADAIRERHILMWSALDRSG
jgi:hypothetical protein